MTATRTDAELQTKTAGAYVALADLLRSATDEQWNVASLCAGWRIR
jgi:hypothetical protein